MSDDKELEPRVDEMFKQKEENDVSFWKKRAFVKVFEVIGFIGTFLCTNPIGFTVSVLITAFALAWDFWLQYSEWRATMRFQRLFN